MAKSTSSVFKRGYNKVERRLVLPNLRAAQAIPVPAGMYIKRAYAENKSTTAVNLSLGNAAAGAQYLAATAVPVAVAGVAGVLYPTATLRTADVANPALDTTLHVTLSAYPDISTAVPVAKRKGAVSVVIEFDELYGSVTRPSVVNVAGY